MTPLGITAPITIASLIILSNITILRRFQIIPIRRERLWSSRYHRSLIPAVFCFGLGSGFMFDLIQFLFSEG